ncbi:phage tail sheath subtilisin-like domain-containing protein [Acinetobacter ursingii]|uniref:phage tail sheath subtilisin-like domain-containing protein n=1 Tax=Acinetobacter ursingii TaxID=108980 RepID=UPI0021CD4EE6|nr:phage tail sheath subtilisin-like domain-containing protein [Acinetobacter ursingii]MCU4481358.1 phage tail sheath subtilisin-like domain-containing protein [Acinetobacter ursingii]MCU4505690.1 phage tail sheath subtilisin-like domain-containing protein [Acinetobacter ursingii]MCU4569636.1 phage tail sheath subtilisin-like domain-containing protein [Acinetobacter ursingii]
MSDIFLHGIQNVTVDDGSRPITTVRSSTIGLIGTAPDADPTLFPVNTPVLIAGSRTQAAKLGLTGTLPDAIDSIFDQIGAVIVVVRVEKGTSDALTLANILGGVDATNGDYEGVHCFLSAENILGFVPKILIAPGFTHTRTPAQGQTPALANPVVAELIGIAERLKAVIIADGPNINDADAIAYSGDFGSKRVFLVDPKSKKTGTDGTTVTSWSSAHVAGLIAKSDNERGWWWSPSNQEINGIIGSARAIDFAMGDANCRANLLNEKNVATIIRQNGYRLWGNRTLSADAKWQFLCVVRTADMIDESLKAAHLWAVDRGITKNYVSDVIEGVNNYLRYLKNIEAILGGECWADPDLNTADVIKSGKVYFDFDFTPVYPAEHIVFRSHLVDDYIKDIFA